MKRLVAVALSLWVCASSAQAFAMMSFVEVGPDVVGTLYGRLDLSGMVSASSRVATDNFMRPAEGDFSSGPIGSVMTAYGYLTDVTSHQHVQIPFGTGGYTAASGTTGDAIHLNSQDSELWLPADYVSGEPLKGTLVFENASYVSLGIRPIDIAYLLPSGDFFGIQVGNAIPEPGSGALGTLALAGLGWTTRRRNPLTRP